MQLRRSGKISWMWMKGRDLIEGGQCRGTDIAPSIQAIVFKLKFTVETDDRFQSSVSIELALNWRRGEQKSVVRDESLKSRIFRIPPSHADLVILIGQSVIKRSNCDASNRKGTRTDKLSSHRRFQ